MSKQLEGKKLLMLGTSIASVSMVEYAQSQGAYVIVTDNLDCSESKAKRIADEIADVSTRDVEKIAELARGKGVDGIISGVSEGNLITAHKASKELGLRSCFTDEQWDLCQNKREFRQLCEKYNVPSPITYKTHKGKVVDEDAIKYPVIVKPVDGSGAIGITICRDKSKLDEACREAAAFSDSGEIIVEEYLEGTEITSVYSVFNGDIRLSIVRDRYPSLDHDDVTAQFDASISPSRFLEQYLASVDDNIKKMLQGVGAKYGAVFFQGIATDEKIAIFECGFRMNALCDYHNIEAFNNNSYMKMIVDYILTGDSTDFDITREKPAEDVYMCVFNMTAHGGKIGRLAGLEEVRQIPGVIYAEFLVDTGKIIKENNSMAQSVFHAYINADNKDLLKAIIRKIQSLIKVEDIDGRGMLFKEFDVNRIVN